MTKIRNDKVREQDALRQEKYYELHKEEINKRRRERHAEKMKAKLELVEKENPTNPTDKIQVIKKDTLENKDDTPVVEQVKATLPSVKKVIKIQGKNDILIDKLDKLDLNPNTKKKYIADLKRLITLNNNMELIPAIRNMSILKLIKETEQYANNTKLGLVQIILFMITNFNLVVNKKAVAETKKYFELLKSNIQQEHKAIVNEETNTIMSFTCYIDKVKTTFGEDSKMYVLTKLYDEATLRDDFVLKIVDKTPKDTNENYIVNLKSNMVLIINTYKTIQAYGQIKLKLTKALSTLIKKYIEKNNLKVGDYLFGENKLSDFVRYNNSKIGADGGISNFRKMKISEELSKGISEEERITLAEKMKHSPLVQLSYVRKLK
jgi:hypothetical protein